MTKIAYNGDFGGFSLSEEAIRLYAELKGKELTTYKHEDIPALTLCRLDGEEFYDRDIDRTDPCLILVIEMLGNRANGHRANLAIAEIPSGTKYRIDEYDGAESVMTIDDYKWSIA